VWNWKRYRMRKANKCANERKVRKANERKVRKADKK